MTCEMIDTDCCDMMEASNGMDDQNNTWPQLWNGRSIVINMQMDQAVFLAYSQAKNACIDRDILGASSGARCCKGLENERVQIGKCNVEGSASVTVTVGSGGSSATVSGTIRY